MQKLIMFILFLFVSLIGCQPKPAPDTSTQDATAAKPVEADAGAQEATDAAAAATDAQAPKAD